MKLSKRRIALFGALLMLALLGCGEKETTPKPGVVFLDPNAAPAVRTTTVPQTTQTAATVDQEQITDQGPVTEGEEESGAPLELYFEGKGVRMEPMMEAAPVLAALGEPMYSFESDSCAYVGTKDLFYYYPGFELTVNEVEGVNRITIIRVADDTVVIPQGLRIDDEEEKLLSILGGTEENGVYIYRSGQTELLIQMKDAEDDICRIWSIEYRVAEDQ